MDGLIRVERQKFPFTIDNILRKYSSSDEEGRSCGPRDVGLKEKVLSRAGGQTDTAHHTCLCCCYCSHCGDVFQTDFFREGETKLRLLQPGVTSNCPLTSDLISSWQRASMGGPRL